jgi:hypothetical protein
VTRCHLHPTLPCLRYLVRDLLLLCCHPAALLLPYFVNPRPMLLTSLGIADVPSCSCQPTSACIGVQPHAFNPHTPILLLLQVSRASFTTPRHNIQTRNTTNYTLDSSSV